MSFTEKYYVLHDGVDRCSVGTQLVRNQEIGCDATPVTGIPLSGDAALLFAAHVRADTIRRLIPTYRSLLKDTDKYVAMSVAFPDGDSESKLCFHRLLCGDAAVSITAGSTFTLMSLPHFAELLQYGYISWTRVQAWLNSLG